MKESGEESVGRQFAEWEHRGRGWSVYDSPIEIEPPLVPLYLFNVSAPIYDDGRVESFFGKLLSGSKQTDLVVAQRNQQLAEIAGYQEYLAEADNPTFCQYYNQEFIELRLIFPKEFEATKTICENLLLSLAYTSHPIGFEIIGTSSEIVIQVSATETDVLILKQQLKSHLPNCVMVETTDYLSDSWINGSDESLIADFGLSNEFLLPLNTSGSHFESDILTTIIGSLDNLQNGEVGIFQVLFQKTKQNWSEEISNALSYFDKTNFFGHKPNLLPLTKQKLSRPLFACLLRVGAKSRFYERSMQIIRTIGAGLVNLSNPVGNELIPLSNDDYSEYYHEQSLLNRQSYRSGMILNLDEVVSLVHPPTKKVVSSKLIRESKNTKSAPRLVLHQQNNSAIFLGENKHQNVINQVFLSNEQRTKHLHLIGSSGSGKSTLLLNLIRQDLENNQGLCVIDPHGDLIEDCLANVPNHRLNDVILFDPSDSEYPVGFNILQANNELEQNLLASDLIATFRRMATSWGDVMDSVLANAILAFVESRKGGTLFDLRRFLVEKDFRDEFLKTISDPSVKYFWAEEYPQISGKPQSSILIRLDSFLRNKMIRNIVCQKQTKLDFRKIMDDKKVLLIKLSQGLIGEENAYLLGTLLVSKIYQTALSRQDTQNRPYFWLYLDEFQHIITPSMENILTGVRKYNIGLHLSHQEYRQLQSRNGEVASSVLSNCYTRVCFRLGDADSEKFANGFSFFDAKALQNLGVGQAITRVEQAEYDFNLQTTILPRVEFELANQRKQYIQNHTRRNFAKSKAEVEAELFGNHEESENTAETNEQSKANQTPNTESKTKSNYERDSQTSRTNEERTKAKDPSKKNKDQPDNTHRYLQNIIKRIGENYGFVATLEKQVFGGIGKIDIALENESIKIACEVAQTNSVEYELQNIQKCLASGFNKVLIISTDTKHLAIIKKRAEELIAPLQLQKVYYIESEQVHLFLEKIKQENSRQENEEIKVKGYTIKTEFNESSQSDQTSRKERIAEILKNAQYRQQDKE